jgi:hypothetical protein
MERAICRDIGVALKQGFKVRAGFIAGVFKQPHARTIDQQDADAVRKAHDHTPVSACALRAMPG